MIEEEITAALQTGLGANYPVYPMLAPPATQTPFIVYTVVSDNDSDTLCGPTGGTTFNIQIDIYAAAPITAKGIGNAVLSAVSFLAPYQIQRRSGYESDTKLYRRTVEFYTLYQE